MDTMLSKALRDFMSGPLNQLIVNLGGQDGKEWERELKHFLRKEPCWTDGQVTQVTEPQVGFDRNEHGHLTLTITGLDLTGAQEIERLEEARYRVGDYAKSCFTSRKADGYDKNHRLVAGKEYKIALVPGKEITRNNERTTATLQKVGEKYGYAKPLAGIIPRIRESVSDKQMEEMGGWYIAALHDSIKDSDGVPRVLSTSRSGGGRWVDSDYGGPDDRWGDDGLFAFLASAS